jgi:DNA end-binding protein Ku
MEVLRYADEVHKAQGYFREIGDEAPDADLLDLATTLIEKKSAPFHPAEFHDRYIDALHRLIDKKAKSKSNKRVLEDVQEPSGGSRSNVIDLMAALKKSVGESGSRTAPAKSTARKAPAKKASAPKTAGKKAAGKTAEKPGEKVAAGKKPPAKKTAEAPARSRKRA